MPSTVVPNIEIDTAILEKIFVGVALLVVILLGVLVLVLTKNRYKQASFKLLDNTGMKSRLLHAPDFFLLDGVSSYHSVSPSNLSPRTSSPLSPRDVSRDISSHCSVTRDLVMLSRSPTGKEESQGVKYDRSKLSIPLQPTCTTINPSRSHSEHLQPLKSPSNLLPLNSYKAASTRYRPDSNSVIPPAVARSLRNINPASNFSSKIDRDLENKLFN